MLGKVGRNFVVVHKRQEIRCAPEQIRAATSEEQELVRAPHAELMGLKHAFEAGQIDSPQYVDLISQGYPTEESPSMSHAEARDEPELQAPAMSMQDRLKAEPTDVAAEGASRNDDNAASVPAEPVNVPSSSTPPDDDV